MLLNLKPINYTIINQQLPGGLKMQLLEYNPAYSKFIKDYYLEDLTYTGTPMEAVEKSEKNKEYHSILCIEAGNLVTFFVLDYGEDKYKYTDEKNIFLLRSFSTDSRFKRKGYAKRSLQLLRKFVKKEYPFISKIVLGVNEKNEPAINLYKNAGFYDTSKKYKGAKGFQKILALDV